MDSGATYFVPPNPLPVTRRRARSLASEPCVTTRAFIMEIRRPLIAAVHGNCLTVICYVASTVYWIHNARHHTKEEKENANDGQASQDSRRCQRQKHYEWRNQPHLCEYTRTRAQPVVYWMRQHLIRQGKTYHTSSSPPVASIHTSLVIKISWFSQSHAILPNRIPGRRHRTECATCTNWRGKADWGIQKHAVWWER